MLYRVKFSFFGSTIRIVTNSKYIADFMRVELKNPTVSSDVAILSNDHAYIEKTIVESKVGVAITPGQSIDGWINYYGVNIRFLQISSFDNLQPIRVFIHSVVAEVLKDKCIPIHASTIQNENHAIAFAGIKNSGKSTLTISHILWKDCLLVADDITFIGLDQQKNVVCDGLFNGVHIFESEKYIYKNKLFYGGRFADEYLKKRIVFKQDYVSKKPITLKTLLFPHPKDNILNGRFELIEPGAQRELLHSCIIRFGVNYSENMDGIIRCVCEKVSAYSAEVGRNFLDSTDFVYDSFIGE